MVLQFLPDFLRIGLVARPRAAQMRRSDHTRMHPSHINQLLIIGDSLHVRVPIMEHTNNLGLPINLHAAGILAWAQARLSRVAGKDERRQAFRIARAAGCNE